MADDDAPLQPQLYLITPPAFDLQVFPPLLDAVLDAAPVACLRLAMATMDEDALTRAADALREIAHARDIPLVIERHALLAQRLGLDGVHMPRGAGASLRKLRADLGPDAIIGAAAGTSRHDGLTLAEAGADYVSFAPMGQTALDDGARVDPDLIQWWSEVIEVPVVVEGALTVDLVESLAPLADFLAFGEEIWRHPDPVAALRALIAPLDL